MRDIRPEGDFIVNGDFTVNEGSQSEYIPFEQMNVEQLNHSLKLHQKLAKEERSRIDKISFRLLGIALFFGLALSLWSFINDGVDGAMFLIGLVGIGMPVMLALKNGEQQSAFEKRQINTINYLATLIRERK
ncbi:Uncharacterised protein [Serratia fonticola]|jgi:hypothetical protein|uniref:Uncharacterized protein n=1 Tax=Serratia fonticola TaxID=47917 RepID=A0A0F7H829_SERFO|nr:hypothetical protein [Serratia fonticola]AKG68552.1 hypothetical protein WN53_05120 [Serratia fonticola]CAI1561632.1 Uncharacterised protein [Serratia fonticola]VTR55808.1 Uncharacterised protein [Serratia fonticola]HBE9180505.1 hypothetical protein [Serratia fonticola]